MLALRLKNRYDEYMQKGFTLLELLVVISIIGILIAITAAAYSTAQVRGRDSKRRGDMRSVQNAFEQYYAVNTGYGASCDAMATVAFLPGGMPTDPQTGVGYYCASDNTSNTYCACATLENTTAGNASSTTNPCTFGGATPTYFCVSNLQ